MIKKLRMKLVAVSMLSLFVVLLVILGGVNLLSYREIVAQADSTLSILKENKGRFPPKDKFSRPPEPGRQPLSPELPYESRFFSVALSDQGSILSVDTGKIAAIDTKTAVKLAQNVWQTGKQKGFYGSYRFACQEESGSISVLGLLAVFVLILLFSRRIVGPVMESYEKQKQFITDAGHEIKTPITIIDADREVLEMEWGENEWLSDIQTQTGRLTALTNDLILLSRMEEGRPPFEKAEIPFSQLVLEAAQSFQMLARARGKGFSIQVHPFLSLWGDEKSLGQLLSILLDNALKYSPPGGEISVTLKPQGKSVCLWVENTADALPPESLPHFFDRFYRGDPSRNSQNSGYGLGLSIAKAIVEAHGGRIQALLPQNDLLRIQALLPTHI